jgi:hypothetical protein
MTQIIHLIAVKQPTISLTTLQKTLQTAQLPLPSVTQAFKVTPTRTTMSFLKTQLAHLNMTLTKATLLEKAKAVGRRNITEKIITSESTKKMLLMRVQVTVF